MIFYLKIRKQAIVIIFRIQYKILHVLNFYLFFVATYNDYIHLMFIQQMFIYVYAYLSSICLPICLSVIYLPTYLPIIHILLSRVAL